MKNKYLKNTYLKKTAKRTAHFILLLISSVSMLFILQCASLSSELNSTEDTDAAAAAAVSVDYFSVCSNSKCDWLLANGDLEWNAKTWHKNDKGILLVGEYVVLSSTHHDASLGDYAPRCYEAKIIANVDSDVELFFEIEFSANDKDKSVDDYTYRTDVTAQNWSTTNFTIAAPVVEGSLKFSLIKEGKGRGVLFFVEMNGTDYCPYDAMDIIP